MAKIGFDHSHSITHICTDGYTYNSSPESCLDIFSFCHELDFDTSDCVSACQFLPTAFECSLAMNSACCWVFYFLVGWGLPAVCKSVFVCFRIIRKACTLVHPLRKLPLGVVLFSLRSIFNPEDKFIKLPQIRCHSI